MLNEAVISE